MTEYTDVKILKMIAGYEPYQDDFLSPKLVRIADSNLRPGDAVLPGQIATDDEKPLHGSWVCLGRAREPVALIRRIA